MNKKITDNVEKLVTDNMRLVPHVLKGLGISLSNPDYDDFMQIGYIGLIKAAKTYDKGMSKFTTYACTCIRNEILMHFRKENKKPSLVYFQDEYYHRGYKSELTYEDVIGDKKAEFIKYILDRENIEKILSLVINCMERKDKIVLLYSMSGLSQLEIAKRLELSQPYISRLKSKITEKINLLIKKNPKYIKRYEIKITKQSSIIKFIIHDKYSITEEVINVIKKTNTNNVTSIECMEDKTIIKLLIDLSSFYTIAQIIQKID